MSSYMWFLRIATKYFIILVTISKFLLHNVVQFCTYDATEQKRFDVVPRASKKIPVILIDFKTYFSVGLPKS